MEIDLMYKMIDRCIENLSKDSALGEDDVAECSYYFARKLCEANGVAELFETIVK
jgi:hypothetical protein